MKDEVRKMVAEESEKNKKLMAELKQQVDRLEKSESQMKEREASR